MKTVDWNNGVVFRCDHECGDLDLGESMNGRAGLVVIGRALETRQGCRDAIVQFV